MRAARTVAMELQHDDTVDLLTGIATMFEKHAWFRHATLGNVSRR